MKVAIERRVKAVNQVNGALHAFVGSKKVYKKGRLADHRSVLVLTPIYVMNVRYGRTSINTG